MLSIHHIEAAINAWRCRYPADPVTCAVCPQVSALATVYAHMIWQRIVDLDENQLDEAQRRALHASGVHAISPHAADASAGDRDRSMTAFPS